MNKKTLVFLSLIFFLAVGLRFYQLGQNPPSLDWDEASLSYNAYTLLKTGRDEYGNTWPLSIRSFNDYKPPFYTYFTILPVALFGLNEFSTRFASAFFGSLTVLLVFFLVRQLFLEDKRFGRQATTLGLLTAFFLAISPWHLQFSRIAFESNVALFWTVLGTWLFLLGLKKGWPLPLAAAAYSAAMFTYHSSRLVLPVFGLGLVIFNFKKLFRHKRFVLLSIPILLVTAFLLWYSLRLGGLQARFEKVGIFSPVHNPGLIEKSIRRLERYPSFLNRLFNNRRVYYFKQIVKGYFDHWNLDFLYLKGDGQPRHHAVGMGNLYLWELITVTLGVFYLLRYRPAGSYLIWLWFLTAPLASSLTTGTPGSVRALGMLPTFQIFTSFGLLTFFTKLKKVGVKKLWYRLLQLGTAGLVVLSFVYYLHLYYRHTPQETSKNWMYGYKQLVEFVNQNADRYQQILVTTEYDQPYIYFLFYRRPLRIVFNPGEFDKGFAFNPPPDCERQLATRCAPSTPILVFRRIDWTQDSQLKNTLVVGTPQEIPPSANIIKEIKFLDGSTAFRLAATPPTD